MTELAKITPDLVQRLTAEAETALSILLPIDTAVRDVRAPEALLRNLLRRAEEVLEQRGLDHEQREALLAPARLFATEADFSSHRAPGLAIFSNGAMSDVVSLTESPPELAAAGRVFHIKPLLPALARIRRFHCLAVSADRAQLFSGTPHDWAEVSLSVPSIDVVVTSGGTRGDKDAERRGKQRDVVLAEYLQPIAATAASRLGDDPAPLVLVAAPEIAGHFPTTRITQPMLRLEMNPFAVPEDELWRRAADLVGSGIEAEIDDAIGRVEARLNAEESTASRRPEEILIAAYEGRVDTVLVAADAELWGQFNMGQTIRADRIQGEGDEDLLNLAAVMTLRQGGRAFAVPRDRLPLSSAYGTEAAALMRY
ncbi:MAG: hypothetical protein M3Y41_13640 [Pseudomonadota bacterium]|nr:hypothetical protein [Pseudomonadota bacterium]